MIYDSIREGVFLERPNRFIAYCDINGKTETVHVKNTGRCRELLISGAKVYLNESHNENRKTKYDLISVYKGDTLVNIDSNAPNKAAYEWLNVGGILKDVNYIKPEVKFGASRLDFYLENDKSKMFVEVKGVTLERNGAAIFPDAPTLRGKKHLGELIEAKKQGYDAAALFVIGLKGCTHFSPNYETDKEFSAELIKARENGVKIIAVESNITKDSYTIEKEIEVKL